MPSNRFGGLRFALFIEHEHNAHQCVDQDFFRVQGSRLQKGLVHFQYFCGVEAMDAMRLQVFRRTAYDLAYVFAGPVQLFMQRSEPIVEGWSFHNKKYEIDSF